MGADLVLIVDDNEKNTIGRIGFDGRYDYGAVGSVMNFASRLCDQAGRDPRVRTRAGRGGAVRRG